MCDYESKAVFARKVTELFPVEVVAKLEALEIFTMSDLSFSAAALPGQCSEEKFLESVSKPILGENAPLGQVARLKKLYWQSCALATSSLIATSTASQHRDGPIDVPPEELAERRSRIEAKYLRGSPSERLKPSATLISRCITMAETGKLRYCRGTSALISLKRSR